MKEGLKQIVKFVGYGNPESAKLFFMGIEEHDEFPGTDFFDSAKGDKYLYKLNPNGATAKGITEQMQCKIYNKMFSNLSDEQIFRSEIHCFNYYPIGAPSHLAQVFRLGTLVTSLVAVFRLPYPVKFFRMIVLSASLQTCIIVGPSLSARETSCKT